MTGKEEYIYEWWEEHGRDPFLAYLPNEQDRRDLESKINIAVNLAINHPANPAEPNIPLINLSREVKAKYGNGVLWAFFRVAAIPDPLEMERSRLRQLKIDDRSKKRQEKLDRMTEDEKAKYQADLAAASRATHTGYWGYHDDDCLCWRYCEDTHCNRNGYNWNCCGASFESSACSGASARPYVDPLVMSDDENDES